jgi:hypothetical protein
MNFHERAFAHCSLHDLVLGARVKAHCHEASQTESQWLRKLHAEFPDTEFAVAGDPQDASMMLVVIPGSILSSPVRQLSNLKLLLSMKFENHLPCMYVCMHGHFERICM